MSRIVYGATPSPFVRKVVIALGEKGLDYELKQLMPIPKTPELMALNPLGKVPIFEEGDVVLPDSSVICAYLERTAPAVPLYPSDAADFGRALFLEEYADTALSEAIGAVFFQRFVRVHVLGEESDESIVATHLEEKIPACFDYLESRLNGPALLGEFSIADIAVGAQLQGLGFLEMEIDANRWPKLAGYFGGLMARPAFQKALG